jgi:hypothetical protein
MIIVGKPYTAYAHHMSLQCTVVPTLVRNGLVRYRVDRDRNNEVLPYPLHHSWWCTEQLFLDMICTTPNQPLNSSYNFGE